VSIWLPLFQADLETTHSAFDAIDVALEDKVAIPASATIPRPQAMILRLGALSVNMCVNIYV
jgi:hypothetical protein